MNLPQISAEFQKRSRELRKNKPAVAPYPQNIVRKRELLLLAQVLLSKILQAKEKGDKPRKLFEAEIYRKVIKFSCLHEPL